MNDVIEYRVFVGWNNGAYTNSLSSDFQKELNELIVLFGLPNVVEIRKSVNGEFVTS